MSEAADKGELILVDGGMCRYHRRRDGVVVVREILVLVASKPSRKCEECGGWGTLYTHGAGWAEISPRPSCAQIPVWRMWNAADGAGV